MLNCMTPLLVAQERIKKYEAASSNVFSTLSFIIKAL
jgi:hypothetical protein